jgi:hypothetical protein
MTNVSETPTEPIETTIEETIEELPDTGEAATPEAPAEESMEETVRKAWAEVKGETVEESKAKEKLGPPATIDPKTAREVLFKPKKKAPKAAAAEEAPEAAQPGRVTPENLEKVLPPQLFSVKAKEAFLRADPVIKKEVADMVGRLQAHGTKLFQNAQRATQESKDILEAIRPYEADWDLGNIPRAQALRQICAAQKYLTENRENGIALLVDSMRLDRRKVAEALLGGQIPQQNGQAQPQSSYAAAPVNEQLLNEINDLKMWRAQQEEQRQAYHAQQIEQEGRAIASEVEQLRNEVGADGRILYPKLHDPDFLRTIVPLVDEAKKANPALTWIDAYRNLYHYLVGDPGASPSFQEPTRNSSANQLQRARAASVSIRGRTSAPLVEMPVNGSGKMEDDVRAAYEQVMRSRPN